MRVAIILWLCASVYGQARTDRNLTLPPAIPPQAGPNTCTAALWNCGNNTGAGTVMTDALYNGIKIIRFTDNHDNPAGAGSCNQPSIGPGGSAEENVFSHDSRIVHLGCSGGAEVFKVLDPVNYVPGHYVTNGASTFLPGSGGAGGSGDFSYLANGGNDIYWGVSGLTIVKYTITPSPPLDAAVTATSTVADFSHSIPCWDSIISCSAWVASQPIDGGANIKPNNNNAHNDVMQLIGTNSGGCTTGGSEPAWATISASEGMTYSDGTCTWVDVGPVGVGNVKEFGGVAVDDSGWGFGNSNGTQGQGGTGSIFINYFDSVALQYYHINTATGNVYTTTCPTDFHCAGETRVYGGNAIPSGQSLIRFHNIKSRCTQALTQCWITIAEQACEGTIRCPVSPTGPYNWLVGTSTVTFVNAVTATPGHKVTGHSTMIGSYGSTSKYFKGINDNTLAVTPYFDMTIGPVCSPNPCTASVPFDQHDSWVADNLTDTGIVCASALSNSNWLPTLPYQSEVFCFATDGSNQIWRQGREYGTGHGPFNTWAHIGSASQDLKLFGLDDDWFCTLGNSNGTASAVCGLPWQALNAYSLNDYVSPTSNAGPVPLPAATNCTGFGCTYQATACAGACTSGATQPTWKTICPNIGNICTDGTITWTNVNSANNRSDTFIYVLFPMAASAMINPPNNLQAIAQ